MKKRNRKVFFIVLMILVLIPVLSLIFLDDQFPHRDLASKQAENSISILTTQNHSVSTNSKKPSSEAKKSVEEMKSEVQKKLGEHLQVQFNGEYLAAIQGAPGKGVLSRSDFDPSRASSVLRRAEEILALLKPHMGYSSDLPLGKARVQTSQHSAQVFYSEYYGTDGTSEVSPSGKVTLSLGPQGELTGFYSTYVPQLEVRNGFAIQMDDAMKLANAVSLSQKDSLKTEDGKKVIWIGSNLGGARWEGQAAYEFYVSGRKIVIHAESGKVIYQRDVRNF